MSRASRFRRFGSDNSGAIAVLFVVLFPALLLIGGLATDVAQLNAQKRYVQSQADLAAMSAVRHLPDSQGSFAMAQRVVAANPRYGAVQLAPADVEFGNVDPASGQFTPVAAGAPAGSVRVTVRSNFRPLLLAPVLDDEDLFVTRSAVASKTGAVVYTLRNRLLSINTRRSVLNGVLGPLGLGLSVDAIDYEGLASARVKVDRLLGLASAGLGAGVLTFDEILAADVPMPVLLDGLGILPGGAVSGGTVAMTDRVTLQEVLAMSPALLGLNVGNVLPDVSVNALDLLTALAALNPSPAGRIGVNLGINLAPLASVVTDIGLIRPPVTVIARAGDQPYPLAEVAQVEVGLRATLLDLVGLRLRLALASAEARLVDLNCAAGPGDVLARFDARTGVAEIDLQVRLFQNHAQMNADTAYRDRETTLLTAGREQLLEVRGDQIRQPVAFGNAVSVQTVTGSLSGLLNGLRADVNADIADAQARRCNGLIGWLVGCLVGSIVDGLVNTLSGLVGSLDQLLQNVVMNLLPLDQIVQSLLSALGVDVAQAELIVEDVSCVPLLVQ